MTRASVNLIVDIAAGVLFLCMVATGYIIRFPLEPGTNKLLTLWGYTRHQWGTIHFWFSAAFLGVLLIHVMLHWQWLVCVIAKRLNCSRPNEVPALRTGLITILVVTAVFSAFAWVTHRSVQPMTEPRPEVCPPEAPEPPQVPPTIPQPSATAPAAPAAQATPHPSASDSAGVSPHNLGTQAIPSVTWDDAYPILESRCLRCHGPSKHRGDLRVDQWGDLFSPQDKQPWILPRNSAASPLINLLVSPKKDARLTQSHTLPDRELAALKAWIDAGADWPKPSP